MGGISRRQMFGYGGTTLLTSTALGGCDLFSSSPADTSDGSKGGQGGQGDESKESPMLAQRVGSGDLPALRKRLPKRPLVVRPEKGQGVYGGTWKTALSQVNGGNIYNYIAYDQLVRWTHDSKFKVVPNLASWEIAKGGREYTFKLREGVKWSDGRPWTADDVEFAYSDVLANRKINPVFPDWAAAGGKSGVLTRVDDYTVKFTFTEPNGLLLQNLAAPAGNVLTSIPLHYFKKFHPKYNSDVARLADKEGYPTWAKLFAAKGGLGMTDVAWWQNADIPTLAGWHVTHAMTAKGRPQVVAERNPYYWKTDPKGRQLPYIDEFVMEVIKSKQTAVLQASQGEFSIVPDEFTALSNKPVYARNRDKGGYHFVSVTRSDMNQAIILLNQTHKNPSMRKVFQNRDFRIGLSYAINRKEIRSTVYQRQGEPWQTSPLKACEFYNEKLAKQYTEYDVARANSHLDRAGYKQRNDKGFRLGPDGKPITFTLGVRVDSIATWADVAQLLQGYFKKVGVDMRINTGSSELIMTQVAANDHDATMDDGYPGLTDSLLNPVWYFPMNSSAQWAVPWGTWYESDGKDGERPPGPVRRQMGIYDKVKASTDPAQQRGLFKQILRIAQEEFYIIGTIVPSGLYTLARNDFHNVPDRLIQAIAFPSPGLAHPEQFYSTQGA